MSERASERVCVCVCVCVCVWWRGGGGGGIFFIRSRIPKKKFRRSPLPEFEGGTQLKFHSVYFITNNMHNSFFNFFLFYICNSDPGRHVEVELGLGHNLLLFKKCCSTCAVCILFADVSIFQRRQQNLKSGISLKHK